MRQLLVGYLLLGWLGLTPAAAEPSVISEGCANTLHAPALLGLRTSLSDAVDTACPRQDVRAWLGGGVTIDTPGFYGALDGGLVAAGRLRVRRWELGATAGFLRYQFVQNAVIKATALSAGPLSLSAKWAAPLALDHPAVAGVMLRVQVPYVAYPLAPWATAVQAQGLASMGVLACLQVHGRLGLAMDVVGSSGGVTQRAAVQAGVHVSYLPLGWLALATGVEFSAGYYRRFDDLRVLAEARGRIHGPWRVHLATLWPLLGADRSNVAWQLGVARDM